MSQMFGSIKGNPVVTAPFYCDYGFNISVGENFYTNHNVTIPDGAKVTFGDNVFIAPNCVFSTAGHAIDSRTERVRTGNPCRVIRKITDADKKKYPVFEESANR